mmetsp:Transcript_16847/g.63908  ORF Transcript_16847/g.63908 Transcript_16847/m.63908 type:complete len:222 (-) Transcript_16847:5324-5989(-)
MLCRGSHPLSCLRGPAATDIRTTFWASASRFAPPRFTDTVPSAGLTEKVSAVLTKDTERSSSFTTRFVTAFPAATRNPPRVAPIPATDPGWARSGTDRVVPAGLFSGTRSRCVRQASSDRADATPSPAMTALPFAATGAGKAFSSPPGVPGQERGGVTGRRRRSVGCTALTMASVGRVLSGAMGMGPSGWTAPAKGEDSASTARALRPTNARAPAPCRAWA